MKKIALLLAILVLAGSLWNLRIAGMKEAPIDYKSEMVQLISNLRAYSKSKKQDFLLLGNGIYIMLLMQRIRKVLLLC